MTRTSWVVVVSTLLSTVACGEVLAIQLPGKDPSTQGYYTCVPQDKGFKCDSGQTLHQFDVRLEPSEQKCENGIYQVHVQTNWHGGVSRVQYQCAVAPIGGFPAVAAGNAGAGTGGQAGSH